MANNMGTGYEEELIASVRNYKYWMPLGDVHWGRRVPLGNPLYVIPTSIRDKYRARSLITWK